MVDTPRKPGVGLCGFCYEQSVILERGEGLPFAWYTPQLHQIPYHESDCPNLLALGTRDTGKSFSMRHDAIIRCMKYPGFKALVLRRTMPDLQKALALDTLIPTPAGWTTMGLLRVGEVIFAKDGSQTRVTAKSTPVIDPHGTFRITFDNGEHIVASAGHKWVVSTRVQRARGTTRVLTTEQIAQHVTAEGDSRSNYAVARAGAWQTAEQALPIDPYVLGVWLGDGTKGQGAFTSVDLEIVERVQRAGYRVVKRPAHTYEWGVRGLMTQLRALGVLRNKHVPEQYLRASYAQRLALLQGLMDTDGSCRKDHLCTFTQTNERQSIARAVYHLAASLGLKPRWSEGPARLNGRDCGTAYTVQWTGIVPVFHLSRKLTRMGTTERSTQRWHYIVACDRIEDTICQCIAVDHPSHEYLVGETSIPTHNSHLRHVDAEMKLLGHDVGYYRESTHDVKFSNGSFIQFSQCEQMKDVSNYLSSEWDLIVFDELSTFPLEMFLMICAACRTPEDAPYRALVRAGSNTLGVGAKWMKAWFIDKNVDPVEYEDYDPTDFEMQFSTLDQNLYANKADYEKRLKVLPPHVKRAWLRGEFVVEGAYFTNFKYLDDDEHPWHVIDQLPTWKDHRGNYVHFLDLPWISIYRAIDWGYSPDPAVCLWIAVLPDGHEVVFKEKHWKRTLAKDVAKAIVDESKGMHIVDTFADPSMFSKDGSSDYSIAETFEMAGVPMVAAQNDRELFGYVICEHLDTEQEVEVRGKLRRRPKMQILEDDGRGLGCANLLRTIPIQTMDPNDPKKIAAGEDHWVVALAYFSMSRALPGHNPTQSSTPYWMQRRAKRRLHGRI